MSEIEKMFKNARIRKCVNIRGFCQHIGFACEKCKKHHYPPFTAEKQLEIVKLILFSTWWLNLKRLQFSENFGEGLAQMVNELWQSLTEEERNQIKEILK